MSVYSLHLDPVTNKRLFKLAEDSRRSRANVVRLLINHPLSTQLLQSKLSFDADHTLDEIYERIAKESVK